MVDLKKKDIVNKNFPLQSLMELIESPNEKLSFFKIEEVSVHLEVRYVITFLYVRIAMLP